MAKIEPSELVATCGQPRCSGVCESQLPPAMREALRAARDARRDHEIVCVAFRTHENGQPSLRAGSLTGGREVSLVEAIDQHLRAKDVIVLSVVVTETTCEEVRTLSHVLVARTRRRVPLDAGQAGS